jgi:hypothetical protein
MFGRWVGMLLSLLSLLPLVAWAAEISRETAQQVAESFLTHYVATYGKWADSANPAVVAIELVNHQNSPIAYNVQVSPQGHVLVPYFDEFTPVMLYSDNSSFIPARIAERGSIESWILPEMTETYKTISLPSARTTIQADGYARSQVAQAWEFYKRDKEATVGVRDGFSRALIGNTVGPLLTTAWDQGDPTTPPFTYNLYTPPGSSCTHTYTGCVATAWSQVLKYWNWPDVGVGSHTYTLHGQTHSANFAHAYDWANMPNQLTASSSATQIQAVARLISDLGIAVDMDYACDGSGSDLYADDPSILPAHFKYKTGALKISRGNYTAAQWFNFFKTEFDALPPRPVIFSVFATNGDGHEIVSDGYRTGATNYVHVNMGWSGYYNGYYDVTNNWTTESDTWTASDQVIVTGLLPDKPTTQSIIFGTAPNVTVGGTGTVSATATSGLPVNFASLTTGICTISGNASPSPVTVSGQKAGTCTVAASQPGNSSYNAAPQALLTFPIWPNTGGTGNLIQNPGFENGTSSWTTYSSSGSSLIQNSPLQAHSGNYFAALGHTDPGSDFLEQLVVIPADAKTAKLEFWYEIVTAETYGNAANDTLQLALYDASGTVSLRTLSTLTNLEASSPQWMKKSVLFKVSPYQGQTVRLRITATRNSSLTTTFAVDDISLTTASKPPGITPILMLLVD